MVNLSGFLNLAINVYIGLIFFRVILSWFRVDFEQNPIFRFVFEVTEPILAPFRKNRLRWIFRLFSFDCYNYIRDNQKITELVSLIIL